MEDKDKIEVEEIPEVTFTSLLKSTTVSLIDTSKWYVNTFYKGPITYFENLIEKKQKGNKKRMRGKMLPVGIVFRNSLNVAKEVIDVVKEYPKTCGALLTAAITVASIFTKWSGVLYPETMDYWARIDVFEVILPSPSWSTTVYLAKTVPPELVTTVVHNLKSLPLLFSTAAAAVIAPSILPVALSLTMGTLAGAFSTVIHAPLILTGFKRAKAVKAKKAMVSRSSTDSTLSNSPKLSNRFHDVKNRKKAPEKKSESSKVIKNSF